MCACCYSLDDLPGTEADEASGLPGKIPQSVRS